MRRLALVVAGAAAAAGGWVWHRLGGEWRRFIKELATDVLMARQSPPTAPRCPNARRDA